MRISDWSSDVCSSDLIGKFNQGAAAKRPAFYDDDSVSWKDTKLGFTVARVPVHQRNAAGLPVDCFDGDLRLDDYRWRIAASLGPRRVWIGPVVKVVGPEKAECGSKLFGCAGDQAVATHSPINDRQPDKDF